MSHDAVAHDPHHPALAHHFDSLEQQSEATTLGMWVFLVTEVLFFGGLFATYMVYRHSYPDAFAAASHELDVTLGTINTVVLITSSLTMALAVHAAQLGQRKALMLFLIATMILGGEGVRVPAPVDHVGREQPAEEQHFGDQEHPHAERGRLALLGEAVEVVRERRVVTGACGIAAAHAFGLPEAPSLWHLQPPHSGRTASAWISVM
jgi:hypothetical protein